MWCGEGVRSINQSTNQHGYIQPPSISSCTDQTRLAGQPPAALQVLPVEGRGNVGDAQDEVLKGLPARHPRVRQLRGSQPVVHHGALQAAGCVYGEDGWSALQSLIGRSIGLICDSLTRSGPPPRWGPCCRGRGAASRRSSASSPPYNCPPCLERPRPPAGVRVAC